MLTNAKVGTKLLALIVAPVMVLLAVASLGARDRLDDAAEARGVENAAELTALTDAAATSLGTERLLTTAFLTTGGTEGLEAARAETDAAIAVVRPALGSAQLAGGGDDGLALVDAGLAAIEGLRISVDAGDVSVDVAIDAYGLTIGELVRLGGDLADSTSAADLSVALGNAHILSRAAEARSELAALGAAAIGAGAFDPGDLERFIELHDEEQRLLARFNDRASVASATELRDALATPEVVAADAQVDALISDATIGAGSAQVGMEDWVAGQTAWLATVGSVDQELIDTVIGTAGASEFDATKAARLFMIVTAGATLLSALFAIWVSRSIDRPLRRLTSAADELATDRLPRLVENLRSPDLDAADLDELEPIEVTSRDEIGQMTEAFNALQQVTVNVAEEQSVLLRKGIGDIFVNLARRNQSLLDRQIEFIDELESKEQDPDLLGNLFRLDHLATRMRRNAESLLVLAGAEPARRRAKPVAVTDVARVAIGEVEDFTRVELLDLDDAIVAGNLAVDLSHLLSELMENATHFSPPETAVEVAGQFGSEGAYVVTIADHGIGMSGEDLVEANRLLSDPPLVGLALGRSLGFTVIGRIAARLGLRVHLNASPAGGVTAVLSLPADLVARPGDPEPRDPLLDRSQGGAPVPAAVDPSATLPSPVATVVPESLLSDVDGPAAATAQDPTGIADHPSGLPAPAPAPEAVEPAPEAVEPAPEAVEPAPEADTGPSPLPARESDPTPTGRLSEALPEGDQFEEGLASLMGPEASDEDVEHQFWGSLADEDREPAAAPESGSETGDEDPLAPEPDASGGLVRRVPGSAAAPAPTTPAADAPRRSPEQVRAMLSRYRDGRKGRHGPEPDGSDGSSREDHDD